MAFSFSTVNISGIKRGDTFRYSFIVDDAFDVTGATAICQLRQDADSPTVAATLLVSFDGQVMTLYQSATLMRKVKPGTYVYDVEVLQAGGDTYTVQSGTITIDADVSR